MPDFRVINNRFFSESPVKGKLESVGFPRATCWRMCLPGWRFRLVFLAKNITLNSNPPPKAKLLAFFLRFCGSKSERVGFPRATCWRMCLPGWRFRLVFLAKNITLNSNPPPKAKLLAFFLRFCGSKSERVGFEPTVRFHAHTLSKRAP